MLNTTTHNTTATRRFNRQFKNIINTATLNNELNDTAPELKDLDFATTPINLLESCAVWNKDGDKIKPCPTVRAFYAELFQNSKSTVTRQEFIKTCIAFGINKATATTQYGVARSLHLN